MAKEFAGRTGYRYKAGIWEEDFRRGLLWKGTAPESYHGLGPSWSWVGVVSSKWSGKVYETNLMKHGKKFVAELVGFSEPTAADTYLADAAATFLTLRGWCKGAQAFVAGKSFYPDYLSLPRDLVIALVDGAPTGTAMPVLKDFPTSKDGRGENMIFFSPDKEFDPSPVTALILPDKAIILCIGEFETWEPGSTHTLAIWALMLEPTGRVDESFRRIGLVKIPSDRATAFNRGFDLRTVTIS